MSTSSTEYPLKLGGKPISFSGLSHRGWIISVYKITDAVNITIDTPASPAAISESLCKDTCCFESVPDTGYFFHTIFN